MQADDIVLNGENIDDIYGHLKLANRILSLEQFKFKQNNGEFDFNGAVNLNTKQVEGKAIIVQADINAAMSMANLKNNLLNGRFDGIAQLNGTYENPHVDLNGTMIDGTLKDYPLQNIQIDAELDNKVVKIDKFYAEQGAGKVAAQGSIDLENGPIDARISASNMQLLRNLLIFQSVPLGKQKYFLPFSRQSVDSRPKTRIPFRLIYLFLFRQVFYISNTFRCL